MNGLSKNLIKNELNNKIVKELDGVVECVNLDYHPISGGNIVVVTLNTLDADIQGIKETILDTFDYHGCNCTAIYLDI